jgi:transcriptional regulator with XRE-family HTH domain
VSRSVHEGFAKRFKQALEEAGLDNRTKKELGEAFSVSAQAVQKWLNGEAIPTAERAPRVAGILGVRRAWLLDDEQPMRAFRGDVTEQVPGYESKHGLSLSGDEFKLLNLYRKLPRQLQQDVTSLLAGISRLQPRK